MKLLKNENGFTLVEIIISIALLSIIAIAIFPVFNNIFSSIFSAGNKTSAIYQTQQKIVENINASGTSQNLILSNSTSSYTINTELINATSTYKMPNTKNNKQVIIKYYKYVTTP